MIWTAAFRTGVISPYEQLKLSEPRGFGDQTVRQVLRLAGGGERLRVRLTNRFGLTPLTIGAATVGIDHALTFDGADSVVIPPGEEAASDELDLATAPGTDLVLSLFLPEETGLATYSHKPAELARIVAGNQVAAPALDQPEEVDGRYFVAGVDVLTDESTIAVAFGDSWFEGVGTTIGANARSVDVLNQRLDRGWVLNQGIAGNRLLRDEIGEHGLGRFERDVLSIDGLTHVLVHFGINDLGLPGMGGGPLPAAGDLVAGFEELGRRAHEAGLNILGATIGPFAGAIYPGVSTPEGVAVRREVNEWIRSTDTFDAVFDVARAVEDPAAPDFIRPDLDSGDGMHLNDAGARAMAESVDLGALS